MRLREPVYVVGGGHSTFLGRGHPEFRDHRHPEFETHGNPGVEAHIRQALDATSDAIGVDYAAMDKVYVSNFLGEAFLKMQQKLQ